MSANEGVLVTGKMCPMSFSAVYRITVKPGSIVPEQVAEPLPAYGGSLCVRDKCQLWDGADCGLKVRGTAEVGPSAYKSGG